MSADIVGLGLRNPGLAAAILATAPPRYAPLHEFVDGLVYCPVDRVHLPPTQPPPAPVRCRICGPVPVVGVA